MQVENQLNREVLIKIIECILQSRINVKKQQIRTFDKVITKHRQKNHEENLQKFLESLLMKQLYDVRNKVKSQINYCVVVLEFFLIEKNKKDTVPAQIWEIDFQEFAPINSREHLEEFQMVTKTIQELLLFLNRQPLFSQYQKNTHLKNSYDLQYKMNILESHEEKKVIQDDNILILPTKYTKERTCKSLGIGITSYFLPKFDKIQNYHHNKLFEEKGKQNEKDDKKTIDCTDSIKLQKKNQHQSSINQTKKSKVSRLYEYYDDDLDFVFLASDDQSFKKKDKEKVLSVEIDNNEEEQEFELLMMTKDQEFIDDNKVLLDEMSEKESSYFQI